MYIERFRATFTTKQVSVIFACAKRGQLKVCKTLIEELYGNVGATSMYEQGLDEMNSFVRHCLDNIFSKNFENAQRLIDHYSRGYSDKARADLIA